MSQEFAPDRASLAILLVAQPAEKRRVSIKLMESHAPGARENIIVAGLVALYRYETVDIGVRLLNAAQPTQAEIDVLAPIAARELLSIVGFSWLTPQGRALLETQNLKLPPQNDTFLHP